MFTEMVHLVGGYGMEEGFDVRRAWRMGTSDEQRTVANSLLGHANFLYSPKELKLVETLPPLITPLTMMNHPQEVAYKEDVCNQYTLDAFSTWLGARSTERPFYSFFNFVDVHEPYELVPNGSRLDFLDRVYIHTPRFYLLAVPGLQSHVDWDALVAGYIYSIEQADAKVGQLVELLRQKGELDRTMIIVTADHGQSFGESGNVFHGCGATDSIVRVPLVVAPPAGMSVPRRVERWVSLCEVDSWMRGGAAGAGPEPLLAGDPDRPVVEPAAPRGVPAGREVRPRPRDRGHPLLEAHGRPGRGGTDPLHRSRGPTPARRGVPPVRGPGSVAGVPGRIPSRRARSGTRCAAEVVGLRLTAGLAPDADASRPGSLSPGCAGARECPGTSARSGPRR